MGTLKEKFNTMVLNNDIANWEKVCEQIADDYAIEFAEWIDENAYWLATKRINELLEIFKKEKGL